MSNRRYYYQVRSIEKILYSCERWMGKYPNEYQFSNTSSDESAQRATSVGKLIRVGVFPHPLWSMDYSINITASCKKYQHNPRPNKYWKQMNLHALFDLFFCEIETRHFENSLQEVTKFQCKELHIRVN